MKSTSVYFNLPIALITAIDDYLATSPLEISRSALLKFCLTFDTSKFMSADLMSRTSHIMHALEIQSNGKTKSIGLRCKKPIRQHVGRDLQQIVKVLVILKLDDYLIQVNN